MARPADGDFDLISVHVDDGDELVIHAGAPLAETNGTPASAAPSAAEGRQAASGPAGNAAASAPAGDSADAVARLEALRRRAEELERAEEGLNDPHTFPHMRRAIIAVLAIAAAAFAAYAWVLPALG